MFDFSWSELLIIVAVAVLVIGPKELPAVMQTLGRIVRRLQYVRYAFSRQFEEFMEQSDLGDLQKSVNFEARTNPRDFDEAAADVEAEALPEDSQATESDERGRGNE